MTDSNEDGAKARNKSGKALKEREAKKETVQRGVNRIVLLTALLLVVLAVAGVSGVFWFVENERERDHQAWQVRLGIVADSRAAAVTQWVDKQYAVLRELSENASLQLYMTELMLSEGDRSQITDEPAQAGYLRNLLVASAERGGYTAPTSAGKVSANVEKAGVAGLALTDENGKTLIATPAMPPITGKLRAAVAAMSEGGAGIVDIYIGLSGLPTMAFISPVYAVQGGTGGSDFIGLIVGVRIIGSDLYDKLEQPGETEQSAET